MSNHNRGLRALAMKDADIINFPTAKTPAVPASEELSTKLEAARERREVAQESTNESDTALARLQERYVVCAEPPAIYDKVYRSSCKEQGLKLLHRTPKVMPPGGAKRSASGGLPRHPETTRCSHCRFRPGRTDHRRGLFEYLWTSPDITALKVMFRLSWSIFDYIFDGIKNQLTFVLNWMALPLQKLGTKMESAILLVGEQGTGKTILGEICRRCHGDK